MGSSQTERPCSAHARRAVLGNRKVYKWVKATEGTSLGAGQADGDVGSTYCSGQLFGDPLGPTWTPVGNRDKIMIPLVSSARQRGWIFSYFKIGEKFNDTTYILWGLTQFVMNFAISKILILIAQLQDIINRLTLLTLFIYYVWFWYWLGCHLIFNYLFEWPICCVPPFQSLSISPEFYRVLLDLCH